MLKNSPAAPKHDATSTMLIAYSCVGITMLKFMCPYTLICTTYVNIIRPRLLDQEDLWDVLNEPV